MKINHKELNKLVKKIFLKYNLSNNYAQICSDAIVNAELVGAHSHGLSRLKMYCERIKKKVIKVKNKITIKKISHSISLVNANNNIGFVAADIGVKEAIKNAKATGIGLVAVKKSGHYGLSSFYLEQAVNKKLICLCFTNAPPAIAPHGAKKSLFGTNPIAFGAPTNLKTPFIFDSSMSKINRGKIRLAFKHNKKIENNVALDKFGKVTRNAEKALEGVQLPIAGFKGSGLAWMVDILSGVFTGSAHSGKVKDPFEDFSGPQNIGHLFIAFKPNLFSKNFNKQMKININRVKKLPKINKLKEIKFPGQNKFERYKKNKRNKIKINNKIKNEINNLLKND